MYLDPHPIIAAIDFDTDAALRDVLAAGGRILIVFILAFLTLRLVRRVVTPVVRVAMRQQPTREPPAELQQRIDTLSDVIYRTAATAVGILAVVTVLPEFGINVGPLIAGLGLVGIAVGFGAQNLVRDMINGIEILLENHYGRGDFIRLRTTTGGAFAGTVEDINLRRTVLRDQDGAVHTLSHGAIEASSNLTRDYSRVDIAYAVAASADLDRVFELIDAVGAEMMSDSIYGPALKEAPRATGLERVAGTAVEVKVEAVTEPGDQWRVAAELRRRLKRALDAAGIRAVD